MISCRGNACTPGMKIHSTSWADPEWWFSTGKEAEKDSWILQNDPGLSDTSHWTGQGWSHLVMGKAQYLSKQFPSSWNIPTATSSLLSRESTCSLMRTGQFLGRRTEAQQVHAPIPPFLSCWPFVPSIHVQWKGRVERGEMVQGSAALSYNCWVWA